MARMIRGDAGPGVASKLEAALKGAPSEMPAAPAPPPPAAGATPPAGGPAAITPTGSVTGALPSPFIIPAPTLTGTNLQPGIPLNPGFGIAGLPGLLGQLFPDAAGPRDSGARPSPRPVNAGPSGASPYPTVPAPSGDTPLRTDPGSPSPGTLVLPPRSGGGGGFRGPAGVAGLRRRIPGLAGFGPSQYSLEQGGRGRQQGQGEFPTEGAGRQGTSSAGATIAQAARMLPKILP